MPTTSWVQQQYCWWLTAIEPHGLSTLLKGGSSSPHFPRISSFNQIPSNFTMTTMRFTCSVLQMGRKLLMTTLLSEKERFGEPGQCYRVVNPWPLFLGCKAGWELWQHREGQCMTQYKLSVGKANTSTTTMWLWTAIKWCESSYTTARFYVAASTNRDTDSIQTLSVQFKTIQLQKGPI